MLYQTQWYYNGFKTKIKQGKISKLIFVFGLPITNKHIRRKILRFLTDQHQRSFNAYHFITLKYLRSSPVFFYLILLLEKKR